MGHRVMLMNEAAWEETTDEFGEEIVRTRLDQEDPEIENAADRHFISHGGAYRAWELGMFMSDVPIQVLADLFTRVLESWQAAGITSFGSRLGTSTWVSVFHYLLRQEEKLPIRFAYSLEIHRGFIPRDIAVRLYDLFGAQWDTMAVNPWLWQHGVSSEGAWDNVQGACLGPDLDAPPEAKAEENCVDPNSRGYEVMRNTLASGYRIVGLHGNGSHALRQFAQLVDEAIEQGGPSMTLERVRDMRLGLAHGTMVGKVPEVMELMKERNVYVPINAPRALEEEAPASLDRYGEDALEFLAPVKSLIENDVKVVGESENTDPANDWYFEVMNGYVNRFLAGSVGHGEEDDEDDESGTEVLVPEEGVDPVTALKLITYRSAEFLHGEELIGSIEPGKKADFIISENDFLNVPDEEIRDNKVIMTAVDGEIVYEDDDLYRYIDCGVEIDSGDGSGGNSGS